MTLTPNPDSTKSRVTRDAGVQKTRHSLAELVDGRLASLRMDRRELLDGTDIEMRKQDEAELDRKLGVGRVGFSSVSWKALRKYRWTLRDLPERVQRELKALGKREAIENYKIPWPRKP